MIVKNIQFYGVQISGEWICPKANLSPVSITTTKAETNYSFPPVNGEDCENLFQNVLL